MIADPRRSLLRLGAISGLLAVLLNAGGIAPLTEIPAAYRPGRLLEWYGAIQAHRAETALSAILFTFGVLAFLPFARGLREGTPQSGLVDSGSRLIAAGGLMNAAATLTPLVVAWHLLPTCPEPVACAPAAAALLGFTLSMDALMNALLGLGMVLVGVGQLRHGPRALGIGGVGAGLLTLPVAGQIVYEASADWLAVAAPCWLAWLAASSLRLALLSRRPRAQGR